MIECSQSFSFHNRMSKSSLMTTTAYVVWANWNRFLEKKSMISDWIKFSRQSCLALFSVWASTHLDYTADWPLSVSSSRLCSCSMLEFADFSVFLFPLPLNSLCLESLLPGKQFPCLESCPMPLNIWSCKSTCYFSDLIDLAWFFGF